MSSKAGANTVLLIPSLGVDHAGAIDLDQRLRRGGNRVLGCDFFEGVAMKQAESICPAQLRSATEEFRGFVNDRFLT